VKILLVEDSRSIRMENERALSRAGYEVICAADGEEALKFAREQQPDLILLDLLLPKMTGTEVLGHLKREPETSNIPVVVVSGLSDKNREKLLAAGADDYLEKAALMPDKNINLLPAILVDVVCRINRRRGVAFSQIPTRSDV
jgi:two-component system cell cycle response regulator